LRFFWSQVLSTPAHLPVTQTVGQPKDNLVQQKK
jgi:hypothetical protein